MAGEVVRIANTGAKPFKSRYNGTRFNIQPGGTAIVPYEAMMLWLGDPVAIDKLEVGIKTRTNELRRLRRKYGVYDDPQKTAQERWEENKPCLEAYDMDGERIITVVDDPEGATINPVETTKQEKKLMEDELARLRRQMAAIQSQLGNVTSDDDDDDGDPVPVDDPARVPIGPRGGAAAARRSA